MYYIFYNNIFLIYVNRYAKCSISIHEYISFRNTMCWKLVLRYTMLTVSKMIMSVLGCSLSMCFNCICNIIIYLYLFFLPCHVAYLPTLKDSVCSIYSSISLTQLRRRQTINVLGFVLYQILR